MSDALLAALVAFCVTLALLLFWPMDAAAELPEIALTAAVYLVVVLVVVGISMVIRKRTRK